MEERYVTTSVGILSDSHDNRDALQRAVRLFNSLKCGMVIHAGDFVAPFAAAELEALGCPVKAVFGNCDGEKAGLSKTVGGFGVIQEAPLVFRHADREVLVIHTHFSLNNYIRSGRYDVIVYGHTHRPEIRRSGRSLIVNPGETGGWVTGRSTVAVWNPGSGEAEIMAL
jgi:putative phosphoesterase